MNRKPSLKSLSEGRGNSPLPSRTHPQQLNLVVYTEELTHLPLMASFFQTTTQPSQLQQSFQGSCGDEVMVSPNNINNGATSGFVPIQVPLDTPLIYNNNLPDNICSAVLSPIGSGINTVLGVGGTVTNPGTPMYLDGTLSTLVGTGLTLGNVVVRCGDLTTTVPVHDNDLVQPYYSIATNSVVLGIGTTQLPFTCNLNVPAGDSIRYLSVQWAKI